MEIKNTNLRKCTAAAFFVTAAVGICYFANAIITTLVYSLSDLTANDPQFITSWQYFLLWLKSFVIPLGYYLFNAVLSVITAVRLLSNKEISLFLRIFCIGNAAYDIYMVLKNGLFNSITYLGEFFGNFNPMSVQRLVTAALLIAIAVLYKSSCGKKRANALIALSAAQYLIFTAFSVANIIMLMNLESVIIYVYSAVISIASAVLLYLPLLLICIAKRRNVKPKRRKKQRYNLNENHS